MGSVTIADPIVLIGSLAGLDTAELDRVVDALARPELRPTPAHELARAHALGTRFDRDHAPSTLAEALRIFDANTYHGNARGRVGRFLAGQQIKAGMLGQAVDHARVRRLLDDVGDDPALPGTVALLAAMTDLLAAYADDPAYDRTEARQRLDELALTVTPDSPFAGLAPMLGAALAVKRGGEQGVYANAAAAAEQARLLLAQPGLTGSRRVLAETMLRAAEAMSAVQHGESVSAAALLEITQLVDRLPADDPAAVPFRNLLRGATGTTEVADADDETLSAGERAWRLWLAATAVLQPLLDRPNLGPNDTAGLTRGLRMLRESAAAAPPGYPHLPMIETMLGRLLCAYHQLGGGRPALDEALRRLESARHAAGHPGHVVWALNAMALALAYRLDGRLARGRETGQEAMRGHAWSVLLQAGTADATAAARHAADEAKEVARWCLADGDPAGAATALDAGRCLLLYAATVTMDVPARLRGLGRADLLARWQHDHTDADLRAEVLTALTGGPLSEAVVPELLDPPSIDEMVGALTGLRADALVYLLPGDDHGPGAAVLVSANGRVVHRALLGLTVGDQVSRHLDVLAARDRAPGRDAEPADDGMAGDGMAGDGVAGDERAGRLDRLCDWAWTAAVGPLLDELDRWPIGRAPRLVLVPMGDLAAVPWHAARDRDGTRAVQVATFSYAASARLLCQNAERPAVTASEPVLMVGDPTGDLPDARAEARAIREAFYPAAAVLDGPAATPAAVRDWLRAGGGYLLHLACHGAVRPGVDGSHLRLAEGRFTARDIVETRRQTAIGLVALAACTTVVPSGSYDEAFSLTTAFLAAGARTVIGSLWPVPSDATSLLMFLVHHYLRAEGRRPVDALNHAQRWMLDPERVVPSTMPRDLAARVPFLTDDVTAWAGFLHQGR